MNNTRSGAVTASLSGETLGFITFIVFLILKLTGTVDWNWFWIWFPLWIPLATAAAIIIILLLVALIITLFTNRKE